jgi:hypothetical protein
MLHLPDECAQEVGHHEFPPPALGATTKKTNPKSSWFSAWQLLIVICDHSTHDPHRLPDT